MTDIKAQLAADGKGIQELNGLLTTYGIISNHRQTAPPGIVGGHPGQMGQNTWLKHQGDKQVLPGCFAIQISEGDQLIIETPGGGGYGQPD